MITSSPVVHRYRVTEPFRAVHPESEKRSKFVTLPQGTVISTASDVYEPGLVKAYSGPDTILVFARDLRERSELIEAATFRSVEGRMR